MTAKSKLLLCDLIIGIIVFFLLSAICLAQSTANIFSLVALTLSILTFYLSLFRPQYLHKPILSFETNVQYSPPTPDEYANDVKSSWFLRLKIYNNGLKPAKQCVGRLIEVQDRNGNSFDRFDPFNLYWSRQNDQNDFSPVNIQGNGDFHFLDIAQIVESDEDTPIHLRIVHPGGRLVLDSNVGEGANLPLGVYNLRVAIYSEDDVFIKPSWFVVRCDAGFSSTNTPTIKRRENGR